MLPRNSARGTRQFDQIEIHWQRAEPNSALPAGGSWTSRLHVSGEMRIFAGKLECRLTIVEDLRRGEPMPQAGTGQTRKNFSAAQ